MSGKKNTLATRFLVAFLLVGFSSTTLADWRLDQNASYLYYVTSKVSAVSEINTFSKLSGSIDDTGKAQLEIDLASVDTAVDIRNQRVREILFEVESFPKAVASLNVDFAALETMSVGAFATAEYEVDLNLHGVQQTIAAELQVTKLTVDSIQVQLAKPLIISAASFNMADGVEELREIAKLPSINNNVVIGFTLLYEK